jgi:glycosyltransferase involved in cell wall biosynthesis
MLLNGVRVVHTVPTMAVPSSGYSYVVARLSQELNLAGTVSKVATVGSVAAGSFGGEIIGFRPGPLPRRLFGSTQLRKWLVSEAASSKFDVVHSHSLWAMTSVYPEEVRRKTGRPFVLSPHGSLSHAAFTSGSWLKSPFWRFLQRPVAAHAACLHATALSELEDIRSMGLLAPVAVIPNGVDVPSWRPLTKGQRRKVLFLGRIHPIKQPERLIAAWARLEPRFSDWDLDIAGADHDSPGYAKRMKDLARGLGLKRVRFVGELTGDGKWEAYRTADLYVLPSKSENFGVTVAEALAAGTPVVVTKGAPWSELDPHGAGWWIDDDVDSIHRAMAFAMELPRARLAEMGAAGHDWVSTTFGWPSIADQFAELYRWVALGCPVDSLPASVRVT